MERLGIVALGNIGRILLKKLVEAGYVVSVYRYRQEQNARYEVIRMGGLPVSSAKEIRERSNFVFLCLPAPA